MTAVEFLFKNMTLYVSNENEDVFNKLFEQALEIEKQQIIDAAANHCYPTCELAKIDAENYYNETYKKDSK